MRSKKQISSIMRKVKSKDTAPEVLLRQALIDRGICVSDSFTKLPGKPDILIPDHNIAIFVDGDFWHGNQWRIRNLTSLEDQFKNSSSKKYWVTKIRKNVIRDSKVTYELYESGWVVIRLWESQIEDDLNTCIEKILEQIRKNTPNPMAKLLTEKSFAEFFAGIGLMRIGLERRGWKIRFANDFDLEKITMYEGHFGKNGEAVFPDDIHKLPSESVPTVTLATASFPCNDLSLAGSRQGLNEGKQSSAFWGFIRVIKDLGDRKPPLILLENVVGFLTSKNGDDFEQALLTLNELGYQVDSFILDAANYVPQSRKRLFVVGIRSNLNQGTKNIIFDSSDARPIALKLFIQNHPKINWAIRPLPSQPKLSIFLRDILEDLPDIAGEWWNEERSKYLVDQMSPKHRKIADEMINGQEWSYGTVFRRVRDGKSMAELRTDGIAGCLRTPRGGSGRQILFKAGNGKYFVRLLTPRECARLMGADDYKITVSLNQALFGFGDAVCVPVIEWITENYLNPLINESIHNSALI
jgi:DNA (cytosine-5)-methyltransferase 1